MARGCPGPMALRQFAQPGETSRLRSSGEGGGKEGKPEAAPPRADS